MRDDLYTPGCVQKTSAFWCAEYVGLSQGSKVRKVIPGTGDSMNNGRGQVSHEVPWGKDWERSQGPTWCPGLELDVDPGRGGGVRG